MMESIFGRGTEDISEVDSDSHWDEDGFAVLVINFMVNFDFTSGENYNLEQKEPK